ncbi:hypothetical protein E1301_Tti018617 [Triplophysa tibetana]|uniref:Uncharacterized protein n=1 Tax=Triplophysa tibetana TaxID=1572043 RepID=A0A5A9P1M0_9TELE|nr:hypothetical protein E1301_Tti018617 [Triplophysa tibetana]
MRASKQADSQSYSVLVVYFSMAMTPCESADTLTVSSFYRACTEPQSEPGTTHVPPLPMVASPASARTGPVKTGGRVFVLDHKRWTTPMKEAIDNLLTEHHGKKDMLKLVDQEYAAMVHNSSTDPNSMLHPTTKLHIAQYVKHLAKLLNTSSSLNTSPEKLLQTLRSVALSDRGERDY